MNKNDPKAKNLITVPKVRSAHEKVSVATQPNLQNVVKQIAVSAESLNPTQVQLIQDQQNLQMQIQQQLQQQILQHKRQQHNQQNLQSQINAIANLKAQIQEHIQMRQTNTNVINGLLQQSVHKKDNVTSLSSISEASLKL